jgi:hypothetical protein
MSQLITTLPVPLVVTASGYRRECLSANLTAQDLALTGHDDDVSAACISINTAFRVGINSGSRSSLIEALQDILDYRTSVCTPQTWPTILSYVRKVYE